METNREMVNSGIPWIGDVPKSWKIVRNKDVFNNSKTLVGENWINTQLLSLTTKGIKPVAIGSTSGKVPDSYETYQVVEKDNLVMCLFDLDCSAVFSGLSPICGMISPAYKALTIKKGYSPDFYAKWFDYIFDGRKFMFLSKNIRYSLTYDEFASLQVVAPSLSEQQRIAEFLDRKCCEIDEMIGLQEQIIEELKAYKQSVITEAVTKGLNPAAPMRDSGIEWIGSIPEHWEVKRLKQESVFINGFAFDSEDFKIDDGVRVIRIGDIGLKADFENCVRAITNPNILTPYRIENGDILIAMSGATTGKCCIVDEAEEAYINQRVGIIRSDIRKIIYYSLQTPYFMEFVNLNNAGSAQPNISSKAIGEFPILNMPTIEQQAIADYLDEKCADIDSLIQTKQSKIDSLKEYKKSIIYEYVTGKREVLL